MVQVAQYPFLASLGMAPKTRRETVFVIHTLLTAFIKLENPLTF